jgi:hypothetical protein
MGPVVCGDSGSVVRRACDGVVANVSTLGLGVLVETANLFWMFRFATWLGFHFRPSFRLGQIVGSRFQKN